MKQRPSTPRKPKIAYRYVVLAFVVLCAACIAAMLAAVGELLAVSSGGSGTIATEPWLLPDGTLANPALSDLKGAGVGMPVKVILSWSKWDRPTLGGEPCWTRVQWSLDVRAPNVTLSQNQRAQAATIVFGFTGVPVPPEALTLTPPPGQTVTSDDASRWRPLVTVAWLLKGWRGLLLVCSLVAGAMLWFTRPPESERACRHCGYDRTGIAPGSLCPECGTLS